MLSLRRFFWQRLHSAARTITRIRSLAYSYSTGIIPGAAAFFKALVFEPRIVQFRDVLRVVLAGETGDVDAWCVKNAYGVTADHLVFVRLPEEIHCVKFHVGR